MGDILPFIAKVRANGDWTSAERARLEDLARRFADHAPGVEAVFGISDDGDPWCVVKDTHEDVLVHVARIDGRFVIHYAANDTVDEGADLHAALSQRLGDMGGAATGAVVNGAFGLGDRHAQTLAALLIAAAFFYDTDRAQAAEIVLAPPPANGHDETPVQVPALFKDDASVRTDRDAAAHGAALIEQAPHAAVIAAAPLHQEASPARAAQAAFTEAAQHPAVAPPPPHVALTPAFVLTPAVAQAAPHLIVGTDGNDNLTGGAGADHIMGGAGADHLAGGGAAEGQHDILDGGAGDDFIEITAQVVAIGGQGADTFVIASPAPPPTPAAASAHPEQILLGVIADFNAREGDRVVNTRGETVQLRQHVDAATSATPETATTMSLFGVTGHRVDVDLNGDGKLDGYLLMGGHVMIEVANDHVTVQSGVVEPVGGRASYVDDLS